MSLIMVPKIQNMVLISSFKFSFHGSNITLDGCAITVVVCSENIKIYDYINNQWMTQACPRCTCIFTTPLEHLQVAITTEFSRTKPIHNEITITSSIKTQKIDVISVIGEMSSNSSCMCWWIPSNPPKEIQRGSSKIISDSLPEIPHNWDTY